MGQAVEVRALEGPQPLMPSGDSRAKRILRVHLALITLRDLVRLPGICISYIATGAPRSSTGPPVPAAYAVRAGEKAPRGPAPAAEMTKGEVSTRMERPPLGTSTPWQAPACWHHARSGDAFIGLRGSQAVQGAGAPALHVFAPPARQQPHLCVCCDAGARCLARWARAPGNLLAPVAGSAVAGAARSGWKRLRIARRGAARRREQERLSGERGARVSWKEVRLRADSPPTLTLAQAGAAR
jgi:hypothetical protein